MSYAAVADLRQRFGSHEIALLDGTGDDRVTAALADAAAEIDAALADVFVLPLPAGPWPLLVALSCDLARHRLYDDEAPNPVRNAAMRARTRLRAVAAGRIALVDATGRSAPRRPLVQTAGPAPALRREDLRDAAV